MIRRNRFRRVMREFAETLAMTVIVFLFLITFVVQGYKVYGSCMEPNLVTGERLLGNKFVYRFESPGRGDVVVFRYPPGPERIFIKRVVGLPGETISINGGEVFVDGLKLDENLYMKKPAHESYSSHKIPANCVFVLGDNRDQSHDSRYWGDLPLENIQAKAWIRYWPLPRSRVLE